jgi:hypothetical protein
VDLIVSYDFWTIKTLSKVSRRNVLEEDRAMQSQVFILSQKYFFFFPNKHVWIESEVNLL